MADRMYYIQTYTKSDRSERYPDSVSRFLAGDYMGSAEFEWGSVPAAWKCLRASELFLHTRLVQSKGGFGKLVTFYVIATESGYERFKRNIDIHLDGTSIGSRSKEYTGLWEKFNAEPRRSSFADLWLDLGASLSRLNGEHMPVDPIAFTDDPNLAIRTILELNRHKFDTDYERLHIGDQIYTYLNLKPFKVCGLNEDGTFSVKQKHGKAIKLHKHDIYPTDAVDKVLHFFEKE